MKYAKLVGPHSELLGHGYEVGDLLAIFDDAVLGGRPFSDWPGLRAFNFVPITEPEAADLANLIPNEEDGEALPRATLDASALQAVATVPADWDSSEKFAVAEPIAKAPKLSDVVRLKAGVKPRSVVELLGG